VGYGRHARFFYVDRILLVFELHASDGESNPLLSRIPCYLPFVVRMASHFVSAEVQSSTSTLTRSFIRIELEAPSDDGSNLFVVLTWSSNLVVPAPFFG
jgi:hypothetical protein